MATAAAAHDGAEIRANEMTLAALLTELRRRGGLSRAELSAPKRRLAQSAESS